MITFHIATGKLEIEQTVYNAYSGYGEYKNRPECCYLAHLGPIPPGDYAISEPYLHERLGPITFRLTPMSDTNTYGRSLFRIHGDNAEGNASHGCIIASRLVRNALAVSKDRILRVLP